MTLKGYLVSSGGGVLFSWLLVLLDYIILPIIGIYLLSIAGCLHLYDYLKKKEIDKVARQISIEESKLSVMYSNIYKLRFRFELKILELSSDITPIEGEINIWDNNNKFGTAIYDPDVEMLGKYGTRDGLYFSFDNSRNLTITTIEGVPPSLKRMPIFQSEIKIKFKIKHDEFNWRKNVEFQLDERSKRELFKKLEYINEVKK
jgi:hypothetical protein